MRDMLLTQDKNSQDREKVQHLFADEAGGTQMLADQTSPLSPLDTGSWRSLWAAGPIQADGFVCFGLIVFKRARRVAAAQVPVTTAPGTGPPGPRWEESEMMGSIRHVDRSIPTVTAVSSHICR